MCAWSRDTWAETMDKGTVSLHEPVATSNDWFGQTDSEMLGTADQRLAEQRNEKVALTAWEQQLVESGQAMISLPAAELDMLVDVVELQQELIDGFLDEAEKNYKTAAYKHSRIRVQLSRPLTVAEAEKLLTDHHVIGGRLNVSRRQDDGFLFKLRVSPNRTHVWVDADLPSRPLYEVVAAALDSHFVNVFPTAVRTFTEYHA